MNFKRMIGTYFSLQEEIYKYFRYAEDWRVFPIVDRCEYYWSLYLKEREYKDGETIQTAQNGSVVYSEAEDIEMSDYYEDEIYHQRFLPKAVYVGEEYTMIVVDTHTDGNIFLAVYDNSKRVEPNRAYNDLDV